MANSKAINAITSAAYQQFTGSKTWGAFINGLDQLDGDVCIVASLIGQVNNGGFSQWNGNRYARDSHGRIQMVLERVGTPTALQVLKWVNEVYGLVTDRNGNVDPNIDADEDLLDEYDGKFYEVCDQLIEDVNAWVLRRLKEWRDGLRERIELVDSILACAGAK